MSFKVNLLIILVVILVVVLSLIFGLFGLARNFVSDIVADIRVYLTVYVDGSWTVKVINDFSSPITVTYLSVDLGDVINEVDLNITIPSSGLHTFSSNDLRTVESNEGVTYIGIVQIAYERGDELYKSTRRITGSFNRLV